MSLLNSAKIITAIEERFDVNMLCYKTLRVWPLIRCNLRTILERPDYAPAREKPRGDLHCASLTPDPDQLDQWNRQGDPDFMFVSLAEKHSIRMSGRYYNPWLDPYIETIQGRYEYLKAEIPTSATRQTLPRHTPTTFLKTDAACFHIPYGQGCIAEFERLNELVSSLCGIEIDEARVVREASIVEQYRLLYLDVLSAVRPRVVCHVCWYGAPAMGLIWACKDLNITSMEIQHAYNTSHLCYEQWNNIPSDGYEVLPDRICVWSGTFKEGSENRRRHSCEDNRAIVGGNAWMQKLSVDEPSVDGVEQSFLDRLAKTEKVVLITMQAVASLPRHVLTAIAKLPQSWLWLFRCHPSQLHMKEELIGLLGSCGIENFEIDRSTDYPLFVLLKRVDHHLTRFSTSCLEALFYGVPTTFICWEAYERYHEHIDAGFFNCVPSSADDLMRFLGLDYDKAKIRRLSECFFDTGSQITRKAFDEILAHCVDREFRPVSENLRAACSNQAGLEFMEQGDAEKTLYAFWSAVKAEQTSTDYLNNLGEVCWKMGRRQDAAKCIETAMTIDPADNRSINNYRILMGGGDAVERADSTEV